MAAFSKPSGLLPMLFALFVFVQAVVALRHVHSSPETMNAHIEETKRELHARQMQTGWLGGPYLQIEGVKNGVVAERKEIRDLKNNADEWNLYILGMELFMRKDKKDNVGFYQIAGVHGRPYITWNNYPTPLAANAGFCPHGQTVFGAWHRPYLALFEQAWHLCVQEVINTWPENQRERLRAVAKNLRMPYWDWAMYPGAGQPVVPATIRDEFITVTKPSGQVTINNPLHSYSWGNSLPAEMGGGPKNNFPRTLRRPRDNPLRSDNDEVNTRIASIRVSLRDRIYGLFAARPVPSYGVVSTSQIGARPLGGNNVDSIESIHDAIHNTVGGESGGHMYYLDYSAFEPIFWLHHTNVDRLLSMYQATTQDSYVLSGRIQRPMAQWRVGDVKDANSRLEPFTKNKKGDYFTAKDAQWTRPLGYYYKHTQANNKDETYKYVNELYGPTAPRMKRSTDAYAEIEGQYQYEGRPFKSGDENYVLNVIANKYAFEGSYSIHCFIGSPKNGTDKYPTAPYPSNSTSPYPSNSTTADLTQHPDYVGNYAVLGGSHTGKLMTSGALPLTSALQGKEAAGCLPSLSREDVEPYLKEHLYYKVIGPGNVEIPANEIADLHVGVKSCPVTPAEKPDELPAFGNYVDLPECTRGKPAGEPYTHVLTELEKVEFDESPAETPEESPEEYPTGTIAFPYPEASAPAGEGECVVRQVVKYVDTDGNFLYEETS